MSVGTSDESHIAVSLCPSVGRAKAVPPWRAVPCWRELQAYPTVTLPCAPPVSIYFWSSLHGYPAQRNRSVNINSIGRVRHSSFHNTVHLYAPVNPPLLSPAGQRRRGWPKGQRVVEGIYRLVSPTGPLRSTVYQAGGSRRSERGTHY